MLAKVTLGVPLIETVQPSSSAVPGCGLDMHAGSLSSFCQQLLDEEMYALGIVVQGKEGISFGLIMEDISGYCMGKDCTHQM